MGYVGCIVCNKTASNTFIMHEIILEMLSTSSYKYFVVDLIIVRHLKSDFRSHWTEEMNIQSARHTKGNAILKKGLNYAIQNHFW